MTEEKITDHKQDGWAEPVSDLHVGQVPDSAVNLNVDGRQLTGALQGFGQMWQKTYSVRLNGVEITPIEVISEWKQKFPEFWPLGNEFYGSLRGIAPGEVGVINLSGPAGYKLSTGIMVIYADDESFTFMTPEGHMFAGWNTFSAFEDDKTTVVQIQALIRANDPLYEMSLRLGFGHKAEDNFWSDTLKNLAAHFGTQGVVNQEVTLVDPRIQWGEAKNIWHNASIRSGIYMVGAPFRWLRARMS